MARDGKVEIRQEAPFAPIYVRTRQAGAESGGEWRRVV
jgi:chromatin segregation and condensation protein Rec8/ScpA/Scc1 (kleisin family)